MTKTVQDVLAELQATMAVPKGRNNDFGGYKCPSVLRELIKYGHETGRLFWKERSPEWFSSTEARSSEHSCNNWNARYAGAEAFTSYDGYGYKCGAVLNKNMKAHRVAWAIYNGYIPGFIDHINGVRDDNRISNLRDVSREENQRNLSISSANTSGVCGVSWCKNKNKWQARIRGNGKQILIGRFVDFSEAVAARKEAELQYGYHHLHGVRK